MFYISKSLILQVPKFHLRGFHKYAVENLITNENRSRTMARLLAMKPIRLQTHVPVKKAVVFVPICVVENKVSLLYLVQPTVLTDHKEKVNFPGDVKHESDRGYIDTALRTSEHLLGIDPKDVNIWGEGKLIVSRSNYSFIPVIGEILGQINLTRVELQTDIEEVFTVPIEDLCNSKMTAYTQFKDEYSSPVFMGGRWRIWGFTAILTNMFLKSLLPSQAYTHRIPRIPTVKKGSTLPKTTK